MKSKESEDHRSVVRDNRVIEDVPERKGLLSKKKNPLLSTKTYRKSKISLSSMV